MSEDEANSRAAEAPESEPAEAVNEAQGNSGDSAESADTELAAAQAQAAQLKDQYVRACAELDNVRKRAERDLESARKYAVERFAGELLGVRDSLEMGLAAAREQDANLEQVHEGMAITERMLVQAMEKFGVEQLEPKDQPFNPEYHEAMSTQESDDHPPNTVVQVVQKGYVLNGRVLRPAMVVVSRAAAAKDGG